MIQAAEIALVLVALVVGPCLIFGAVMLAADVISDHVVPRLLLAPMSYPATGVAWLMLLGIGGVAAGVVGAVVYWL